MCVVIWLGTDAQLVGVELCRYASSCREWDIQTPIVQLTTLCTSAWNNGSVDANLASIAVVVGRHRECACLVSWKGSEMEKICSASDQILSIGPRLEYE